MKYGSARGAPASPDDEGSGLPPDLSQFLTVMARIADGIESIDRKMDALVSQSQKPVAETRDAAALAALALLGPDIKAIAQETGIHVRTLYRLPKFRHAYNLAKMPDGDAPRGWKEKGDIEAWDDPDDVE